MASKVRLFDITLTCIAVILSCMADRLAYKARCFKVIASYWA